tara:strand:- start:1127 stop:1597 length:471 start_codon:yes stop_codon:yes gene_type:complete
MRNLIILLALSVSAFSFGQTKGQYTFGIGQNFTTADNTANVGYFVMDGLMVSLEFHMMTDSGAEDDNGDAIEDGSTDWGFGARYYIGDDGLWAGVNMNSATDSEGEDAMDMGIHVGCSKVLGFDGKLWFEPSFGIMMPAANDAMHLGLGMGFRFAF